MRLKDLTDADVGKRIRVTSTMEGIYRGGHDDRIWLLGSWIVMAGCGDDDVEILSA